MEASYICPACGYPGLFEEPRSESGGGSYENCPSCGFEYGYTDEDLGFSYEGWRARWIEAGARWQDSSRPAPLGWDATHQLRSVFGLPDDNKSEGQ